MDQQQPGHFNDRRHGRRQVSEGRKALFYIGLSVTIIGAIMFGSVFLSAAMNFGNFDNFDARGRSFAVRAFGGMGLIVVGGVLMNVGRLGMAGSGVILDPEKAREDLEPWSRMGGGMLKDVLDEADVKLGRGSSAGPAADGGRVIMIRCTACGKLNEEDSKFCQECGRKI